MAESGQSYDLMDEHQTIREFLQAKMKGNGCGQVRGRGQEGSSFVRAQARRNATQVRKDVIISKCLVYVGIIDRLLLRLVIVLVETFSTPVMKKTAH